MEDKHIPFYVIKYNTNSDKFYKYDVIPYLINRYENTKKKDKPTDFEGFKKFVESWSMYQWWSRCEYEIILSDWPNQKVHKKVDIYWQIMNNIDVVIEVLMKNIKDYENR